MPSTTTDLAALPATYRRQVARNHPDGCVICGPGCCRPVLAIHLPAAEPEGGNFRLPPTQPQVSPSATSTETADVR